MNFRIVQKDSENPQNKLDLTASIPEEVILAKIYQIQLFGVSVPKNVNLNLARKLSTKPRLEYLKSQVGLKTVKEAYEMFREHLDNKDTQILLGKFGAKYDEIEDSDAGKLGVYLGFYAYNPETRNMMFFREEETGVPIPYRLHAYIRLSSKKATQLEKDHEIFN